MPLTPLERLEAAIAKMETKVAGLEIKIDEATGARLTKSLETQRDALLSEIVKLRETVTGYNTSWEERTKKAYYGNEESPAEEEKTADPKGKKKKKTEEEALDEDLGTEDAEPEGAPCPACQAPLPVGEPAACPRCRTPIRWS